MGQKDEPAAAQRKNKSCRGQTGNPRYGDPTAATALTPFPFSRACHKQKHTDAVSKFSGVCFFFFFLRY